ncbi:MAG: hypothetical protein HY879_20660 [Deltaproteobacteria bacterium]|nr:hypothetical protein [Deltaproteobacteria bacterium]
MSPARRKDRLKNLVKMIGLLITILSFLGVLSCYSGTSSTTSSGNSSGTGTGWTITIQIGTNPLLFSNTTAILAIVKDRTGAPAPRGTNVCTTVVRNGLLKPGSPDLFATICETTTNDIGQTIQTYSASLTTGIDTIEVSSQGVIAHATITVN